MHELGIAQAIADAVTTRATERQAARVISVRLRIGEAAGVMPDALQGCWEMVASVEPALAGAALVIESVPHRARCRRCAREFAVVNFVAQCPACGAWDSDVISGTELEIREMEIEPMPAHAPE
ncbi:MAG: hydrogenase maturation nickel metallochaperone HypA [Chloroflexi bacterium]|nr:hydrogenase maturation nickel metallochaperone HypA [Chloroflexota bacterium]